MGYIRNRVKSYKIHYVILLYGKKFSEEGEVQKLVNSKENSLTKENQKSFTFTI